ncbi:hypothetical protein [Pseudomonas syringae]|uniref:hypothetical protein n=1 Tax=Pseudomonas syringae TaxID=317 RepID=UPI000464BE5A|nr:hypothetical protein [Pseudomonas syringae]
MVDFFVMGEDQLCCDLAIAIVRQVCPGSSIANQICAGGFGPFKDKITALNSIATRMPVLMLADGDQDNCVVKQRNSWMPARAHENLILRLAVREAESWVLADHEGFSQFAELSAAALPPLPDEIRDPKEALIGLIGRSKRRILRDEMLPNKQARAKTGLGYNLHLTGFVKEQWCAQRASERSPSLARSILRVERFL